MHYLITTREKVGDIHESWLLFLMVPSSPLAWIDDCRGLSPLIKDRHDDARYIDWAFAASITMHTNPKASQQFWVFLVVVECGAYKMHAK